MKSALMRIELIFKECFADGGGAQTELLRPGQRCLAKIVKKSKIWASALRHVGVVTWVSINEELKATKAANELI